MNSQEYEEKLKELKTKQIIETGKLAEEYLKSMGVLDSVCDVVPARNFSFNELSVVELKKLHEAVSAYREAILTEIQNKWCS